MSVKLTVIYENPEDPKAFEEHYASVHVFLADKLPSVTRFEFAKVFPKEDGSPTPAYRTMDFYFADYATANLALGTSEAKAVFQDAFQLATGGVKFLLSDIEVG